MPSPRHDLRRRVVPGTTYLLSRRTLDRRFYLRPSAALNQIYEYALARALQQHGRLVHAFVVMSNHPHEVVTDVHGVLPDCLRDLRREIALAAKQLYRIHDNFWSAEKPSAVELHGAKAQLDAVLYTVLNPVRAGLVTRAVDWPGAIALPGLRRKTVSRPKHWFSENGAESLVLELTPVPAWNGTHDEWDAWLKDEVASGEADIAKERRGKRVLGRKRVLAQHPFDRPQNRDELVPSRNPTISTGRDGLLMRSVLGALRAWRRAYREARERWRLDKLVQFPLGTWWASCSARAHRSPDSEESQGRAAEDPAGAARAVAEEHGVAASGAARSACTARWARQPGPSDQTARRERASSTRPRTEIDVDARSANQGRFAAAPRVGSPPLAARRYGNLARALASAMSRRSGHRERVRRSEARP